MNSEDGQVYSVCILPFSCFTKYNRMQNVNIADETLTDYSFLSRYHYSKSKNYLKDDIEFVTEFPWILGHPVRYFLWYFINLKPVISVTFKL